MRLSQSRHVEHHIPPCPESVRHRVSRLVCVVTPSAVDQETARTAPRARRRLEKAWLVFPAVIVLVIAIVFVVGFVL